ncbi:copper resistance protein NlpE N-terminal domain-containing protein [Flavihumibacter profundi]|uniref:copper resistance protein NlpE N-terminal domain-containing protein n=1 Tax=Flavihumibacter profundi TaxID=2716883 RepID=UPI001CC4F905|nr:copper resistance protein NlpE N-terminal domain-containing protein [Flavihumibacter profundi]MBZ5859554.1 copper resistance protein NlpE N-terminal domain-containing protein [Flavihumibacter profundi]
MKLLAQICITVSSFFFACNPASKTISPAAKPDSSMTSLDRNGVYYGILPCADCEGIETVIHLNKDNTYSIKRKYLGKSTDINEMTGRFTWNSKGNKISLEGVSPGIYLVGENKLIHLDMNGNSITGDLAAKYVLVQKTPGIVEKYWKLTELNGKPVTVTSNMKKEAHMILKAENNQVNLHGGCNSFTGTYELKPNNKISFGKFAGTLMACPDLEMETQFLKVIETADSYILEGDKLVLNRAKMAPLARFEAVYFQ